MSEVEQTRFELDDRDDSTQVEGRKFEPIKGYPMLHWRGKRPFTSTVYYPAQLKEKYGEPVETPEGELWRNKLYWGDNLQVMSHLLKEYRGKVQLVYIDPPFDSKAEYKKSIRLRGTLVQNDQTPFEEKQYSDIWTNDEYLQFIYERMVLLRELMAPEATIWVHSDWHKVHHLRSLLDEVMGPGNFLNEIVWRRIYSHSDANRFGIVHDTILAYSKTNRYTFNKQYRPHSEEYIRSHYGQMDPDGRQYRLVTLSAAGPGPARRFGDRVLQPPPGRHWAWSQERIDAGLARGKIVYASTGQPNIKQYLDETRGTVVQSIWEDLQPVNPVSAELLNYPTQKPEALLSRIIEASSNPGDIVFDCFMGSGTTQAVAMRLGRRFIGADINLGAVQIATKRLIQIAKKMDAEPPTLIADAPTQLEEEDDSDGETAPSPNVAPTLFYTGFEVYNVNNYDVFRNL